VKSAFIVGLLQKLCSDDQGAAASEYAISLAFIAVAVAAAASLFNLTEIFPALVEKITGLIG